jgi:nicotinamidase-related amidase
MKPALLVIDVQKDFFDDPVIKASLEPAIEYINAAIDLFRKKQLPIICIQDMDLEDNRVPGEDKFDVPESLHIHPEDPHIHKLYGNAFNKTDLGSRLQHLEVDTLIITGYCAENCVLSTYRGALDLDFTPILLRDSLASGSQNRIRFVEEISDVISYGALEKLLGE